MLKSKVIEEHLQKMQVAEKSVLQLIMTPIHDAPCLLEEEAFLVSFKNRSNKKVSEFNLMPASRGELRQLALFLGTCASFNSTVTHEIVPGQHIISEPVSEGNVMINLLTDPDLLELLADSGVSQTLNLILNIDQLEAYEEFITSSIATNDAIHSFNSSALEAFKQLQLAS